MISSPAFLPPTPPHKGRSCIGCVGGQHLAPARNRSTGAHGGWDPFELDPATDPTTSLTDLARHLDRPVAITGPLTRHVWHCAVRAVPDDPGLPMSNGPPSPSTSSTPRGSRRTATTRRAGGSPSGTPPTTSTSSRPSPAKMAGNLTCATTGSRCAPPAAAPRSDTGIIDGRQRYRPSIMPGVTDNKSARNTAYSRGREGRPGVRGGAFPALARYVIRLRIALRAFARLISSPIV